VKERITAQLESANNHIKMLEARLERLKNAAGNSIHPLPLDQTTK
jgi:hypothetical protein